MRKFDPWPVFFKREWNRNWPFLVGFAITGALITKFTAGLTEEDAKKSRFVQDHNSKKEQNVKHVSKIWWGFSSYWYATLTVVGLPYLIVAYDS